MSEPMGTMEPTVLYDFVRVSTPITNLQICAA